VALIAADISRRTIYPRPPIFSYLLFAVTLLVLSAWKSGRLRARWLWLLPLMMIPWANLHGMCLLGIIALGCFALGEIAERRSLRGVGALLCALTAVTAAAALLNPSGHHIFFLGKNFTNDPLLKRVIAEMLPPPLPVTRVAPGDSASPLVHCRSRASPPATRLRRSSSIRCA
jgi:hypothetical protein